MKNAKRGLFVVSVFALTLLLPAAVFQDKTRVGRAGRLQHDVTVALKLIQVYVRDGQGRPVTHLEAEDFEVEDNGRPQKITDFEVHSLAEPPSKSAPFAAAPLPSPPAQPARTKVRLSRKFFLLIDYFRNDISGIGMAKKAARRFLETQVQPTDETALLSYSILKGIKVAHPPTTDRQAVLEALDRLKEIPYLDDGIDPWPGGGRDGDEKGGIPVNARNRADLVNAFSAALQDFSKYLRTVPGFKNVILYSRGISYEMIGGKVAPDSDEGIDPSESMEADIWGGKIETGGFTLRNYENMVQDMATANSAVYSVNTQGLKGYQKKPFETVMQAFQKRGEDSLRLASDITGGEYFADAINSDAIARTIQNATSNYYILGYYVSEAQDGAYHSLTVKVQGKDYRVRAPRGYFNPRPFAEATAVEKELHLLALAHRNRSGGAVPFAFEAAAFPCPGSDPGSVLLLTEIPAEVVKDAFGPNSEAAVFVFAKNDEIVYSAQGAINLTRLPDRPVFGYLVIPLPPGEYDCRVVFRDLDSGQGAVAASPVSVAAAASTAEFRVFPPLLFEVKSPAAFINLTRHDAPDAAPKLLQNIYGHVSNRASPVIDVIEAGSREVLAAVVVSGAAPDDAVSITGALKGAVDGRSVPLEPLVVASGPGQFGTALLLSIEIPCVEAGSYTLSLTAKNEVSGAEARTERTFQIRIP